jgi:hypothetical protein
MKKPERVKRGIEGSAKRRGRPPGSKQPKVKTSAFDQSVSHTRTAFIEGFVRGYEFSQALEAGDTTAAQRGSLSAVLQELAERPVNKRRGRID